MSIQIPPEIRNGRTVRRSPELHRGKFFKDLHGLHLRRKLLRSIPVILDLPPVFRMKTGRIPAAKLRSGIIDFPFSSEFVDFRTPETAQRTAVFQKDTSWTGKYPLAGTVRELQKNFK